MLHAWYGHTHADPFAESGHGDSSPGCAFLNPAVFFRLKIDGKALFFGWHGQNFIELKFLKSVYSKGKKHKGKEKQCVTSDAADLLRP
jgi:hypothetical protein